MVQERICLQYRRYLFNPWVKKRSRRFLSEREWQHTPVFLPGKSHRQRNLESYSPWDLKELDKTELLNIAQSHQKKKKKKLRKKSLLLTE